jgi:hypothetical protein
VDVATYGAIAGVASITTALQSLVALLPLRSAIDINRRKSSSSRGFAAYNDAKHDAGRDFAIYLVLNVVAVAINGSVLAAWWKVGVANVDFERWEYWVPWVAVVIGSGVLFVTAVASIVWLATLAWRG